ncbi:MAG: hypothetical protein RMK91_03595 [Pseudanabaenaceae cyanobacterium SKYGB_i_bin29]|nr:hypothetical protein [Pseudanabaenaceae cyanobacterium SKYG29]MDW8420928.1 hypothetical protein [Pseudanabaenaceae cyanobacterium SKYGB_i_bin29]
MSEASKQRIQEHIRRSTGANFYEQRKEKENQRKENIMRHLRLSTPDNN